MNKIYKVVWNAARNCYVVGSEFISKTRRGGGYRSNVTTAGTRTLLAVCAACGISFYSGGLAVAADNLQTEPTIVIEVQEQKNEAVQPELLYSQLAAASAGADALDITMPADVPAAAEDTSEAPAVDVSSQHSIHDENGYYVYNGTKNDTYNSLTKDGLWVGGVDDNTGFHVDNTGHASANGLDVQNQKITGVAGGEFKPGSTEAVTAGQLYDAGIVPGKAADGSVAIGNGSNVTNINGVAIGNKALVNYSAENGVAIGQGAEVRTDNATAIGQGSRVVSGDGSVALGQGSMVTATDAKSSDPHGVVSVGLTGNKVTEGFTRRIINVADGTSDSDAATYGQVKDVDAKIGDLDFSDTHSLKKAENVTDALTKLDTKAYNLSGKIDDFSRSGIMAGGTLDTRNAGTNSIQLGNQARAAGQNSIAFGAGASVTGENTEESILTRAKNNGVAIGYSATAAGFNTTVLGAAAKAQGDNATALGQGTLVTADNSVALGAGSRVTTDDIRDSDTNGVVSVGKSDGERRIINVADGVNDSDAATVGQISKITGMDSEKGNVVQYDGEDKSTITFAGTNGTALNNVNDIVMNVKNPINKKTEQHSFQNAGLLPGKVEGTATSGKWNMAIGEGSEIAVDGGTGANMKFNTAIGNSAGVSQAIVDDGYEDVERSTAIGHAAKVRANNSTAIGDSSNVSKDNSVAVGQKAEVQSATSIAIGQGTKIGSNAENSIAIGTSANQYSVGSKAKNSTVVGVNAWSMAEGGTVLGKSAKIQGSAANGTAIGTNATINVSAGSGNVALGADSTVSKADVGGDTAHGVVSVGQSGDNGFTRRIINVADGVNDSDAATYGQVKAVQSDIDALDELAVTYTNSKKEAVNFNKAKLQNIGDIQLGNATSTFVGSGLVNGKVYDTEKGQWAENGAEATHSMAVGKNSSVRGTNSIAVGPDASVNNGNSAVLEQSTAIGFHAAVAADNSTALGANASVLASDDGAATAIGANSQAKGANATAIGANVGAGENSVVIGGGTSLAAARAGKANATAIGTYVDINADKGTAIGYGAQIGWNGKNSVSLGADSTANEADVVSVGHVEGQANGFGGTYSDDLKRRIINVADGVNDSDAATVGQIKTMTGVDAELGAVVQYDDADKNSVTFQSTDKAGTTLNNVNDITMNVETYLSGTSIVQGYKTVSFKDAGIIPGTVSDEKNIDSVVLGRNSNAGDKHSVVIGVGARTVGSNATAIGQGASADANNSMAIGSGSKVTGSASVNGTAVGTGSGVTAEDGTALGYHAYAWGEGATVIGSDSRSYADGGTTLGQNARIQEGAENSVALGKNSYVSKDDILASDTNGVVSVGISTAGTDDTGMGVSSTPINRRIINVADGVNDNDAATVGQLNAMQSAYTDSGIVGGTMDKNTLATGAVAIGKDSNVHGTGSIAIGTGSKVEKYNSVAIGRNAIVKGAGSVALGASSVATEDNVLSLGRNDGSLGLRIVNMKDGINERDAVTVGQMNALALGDRNGSLSLANGTTNLADGIDRNTTAIKSLDEQLDDVKVDWGESTQSMKELTEKASAFAAQTQNVDWNALNSVDWNAVNAMAAVPATMNLAIDDAQANEGTGAEKDDDDRSPQTNGSNPGKVDGNLHVSGNTTLDGTLNVKGDATFEGNATFDKGATMKGDLNMSGNKITGLGAGDVSADSTDAVNGSQLFDVQQQVSDNRNAIGALGSRVSDLGEEVDSVGAISAALAGLHPLDYNGTGSKFQISAALGTYDGTQAAAIGGFYHFNRDTLLSIGGSTSFEGDRKTAANVGVTFRVGEGASEAPAVQDTETKQQMEAMKQEIEMLKAELEQLKNKDTEGTNDKN